MQRTPPKTTEGAATITPVPRSKRQRPSNSPVQHLDKQDEMMSMIAQVLAEISEIRKTNVELKTSLEFVSRQYDDLTIKIKTLENEHKSDRAYIKSLESKIEGLQRNTRLACVEIRNVPTNEKESKTDLLHMVQCLNTNIKCKIDPSQIRDVYRSKSKSGTKPIILEFTTVLNRDQFLMSVKKYNKNNSSDRINSSLFGLKGPKTQVYISESLIPQTKRLFMRTKDISKQKNFKYCWTSHGYIYIRKNDGSPLIRINTEEDLLKINKD
ncbi:unnamed protein product [Colias eurytheme]|nr:unnamed protein product [Colias eurytheme]